MKCIECGYAGVFKLEKYSFTYRKSTRLMEMLRRLYYNFLFIITEERNNARARFLL